MAEVAKLMTDAGLIVFASLISPMREHRRIARDVIGADRFFEVFVDAPLNVLERRDPKGLYRRARAGRLAGLTGLDAPYEIPQTPDLHLQTSIVTAEQAAEILVAFVRTKALITMR